MPRRYRFISYNKTLFVRCSKICFSETYKATFYVCDNSKIITTPQTYYSPVYLFYEKLYINSCKTITFKGTLEEMKIKIRNYLEEID